MQLSISVLGSPRFELDGQPVNLPRRKATALLAYLAVMGEHQRREALAAFFWPDSEQARAYAYLRNTVWEINRALGSDWLLATRETVGVNPAANIYLDLKDFRTLLAQVSAHPHTTAHGLRSLCRHAGSRHPTVSWRIPGGIRPA